MRTVIFFLLIQSVCAADLPPNPRFTEWGTHIPARADLEVRWNAPSNSLPSAILVYHLFPRKYSPDIISNLMDLCSFTDKERIDQGTNGVTFKTSDDSRRLDIFFPLGSIEYQTTSHYSHTNLAEDVPEQSQMPELTSNALDKTGISVSDIETTTNGVPNFHFWHPLKIYYVNRSFITNIEFRSVRFQRSVDGVSFLGIGAGGDGEFDFGEHGRITKIDLSWRNLERYKAYPTITPELMINLIRNGRAIQGLIPDNVNDIDWPTVKSVTVKSVKPCYYAGDPPSDWLFPFAALWTTVDTGSGTIDVEIDCPIIDESNAGKP